MPTGYTYGVKSGEVSDFTDFALQCARAFGAAIMLRDAPSGPIPDKLPSPSSYHETALVEAENRLAELMAMSSADADEAAERDFQERFATREAHRQETINAKARYEAMLEHVKAWEPPTPDHQGLKDFMVSQLIESIDFDCRDIDTYLPKPQPKTGKTWLHEALAQAREDVQRHTLEATKDRLRDQTRQKWVDDLRASLPPTTPNNAAQPVSDTLATDTHGGGDD